MTFLVVALVAMSVGLMVVAVAQLLPTRSPEVSRRLAELESIGVSPFTGAQHQRRQARRRKWEDLVATLGDRVGEESSAAKGVEQTLTEAGIRDARSVALYHGVRIALPLAMAALPLLLLPLFGVKLVAALLVAMWAGMLGLILPKFYVGAKAKARKKELQKALADTLDLLVVCVEAGLGLNQAMHRVSEEIRHVSLTMSQELALVNLEMRAGTPREDALRNLSQRNGVEDLRSLTAMLIQTDRFGTSIAQALRVHSDTLRTKRRQRAEEAAAKTTIKMLLPLVFFIFPAMFVVILGPALIKIVEDLGAIK